MTILKDPSEGKKNRDYRQISLLAAVPAILVTAPLIGFFAGQWADEKFGTEPYLMTTCLVLGFIAAGREIWQLVKKAQALEEKNDNDRT
ncbi:MAG: AtpZ/AtpI family protein [candidate division Zixibacteria bacterium]